MASTVPQKTSGITSLNRNSTGLQTASADTLLRQSPRISPSEKLYTTTGPVLPRGPCHFQELSHGPKAPICGCRRFYQDSERTLKCQGQTSNDIKDEGNIWCFCGHHACFHALGESIEDSVVTRANPAVPSLTASIERSLTFPHRVQHEHEEPMHLAPSTTLHNVRPRCRITDVSVFEEPLSSHNSCGNWALHRLTTGVTTQHMDISLPPTDRSLSLPSTDRNNARSGDHASDKSNLSSSGLPRIPSMCLLSTNKLQSSSHGGTSRTSHFYDAVGRPERDMVTSLPGHTLEASHERESHSDSELARVTNIKPQRFGIPRITGGNNSEGVTLPNQVDHLEHPRSAGLSVQLPADPSPGFGLDDLIQSATEIATPSVANTPDLEGFATAVHETKKLVSAITDALDVSSRREQGANSDDETKQLPVASQARCSTPPPPRSESPSERRSLQAMLQRLIPQFHQLHRYLAPHSSIATCIKALADRVDSLESASFAHIPVEELQERFEHVDGRLLDVEGRLAEHERFHAALDGESNSRGNAPYKSLNETVIGNGSFASGYTVDSASSSALVVAAIDRVDALQRLGAVEQRLDDIEISALPTYTHPWDIEVILIPWGRHLKGVWFSPDEISNGTSDNATQDSEGWTQPRSMRASTQPSISSRGSWSSQVIHSWAEEPAELMVPRACGINGIAYKRLQSRGFVKTITLKATGAREVETALRKAFAPVLSILSSSSLEYAANYIQDQPEFAKYLGLQAPLIPLRKVHKSSRLRFLSRAEMLTPTNWTVDFLASGVIMRAAGGMKRLFVTHRDAYLQPSHPENNSRTSTWQKLRELPRRDIGSANPNLEYSHVGEADAKEDCWVFHSKFDDILLQSSFTSNNSKSSFMSNNLNRSSRHISTDSQPQDDPNHDQCSSWETVDQARIRQQEPLSPLSEFPVMFPRGQSQQLNTPPLHRSRRRHRTLSVPLTEDSELEAEFMNELGRFHHRQEAKRNASRGEVSPSPLKGRRKRRRVIMYSMGPNTECLDGLLGDDHGSIAQEAQIVEEANQESDSSGGEDAEIYCSDEDDCSDISGSSSDSECDYTSDVENIANSVSRPPYGGFNFTPRRSKEPPSPHALNSRSSISCSDGSLSPNHIVKSTNDYHELELRRKGSSGSTSRSTPFAYATPHSASTGPSNGLVQYPVGAGQDINGLSEEGGTEDDEGDEFMGDTEVESFADEVWEGVLEPDEEMGD
ncbi:hypothetical protein M501DRAFT_997894 [Patellaria atrata CBS 101060]|uniref:Uncharacterized protein n=1 Tax=Patellaria atrata CBS 101060 TaxID=1346257 RepID=A0A9P4VMZ1_9PEZI|nr:hypothetical protein M501DRAFT_997894 [Patellaria atrata CBS 101060]